MTLSRIVILLVALAPAPSSAPAHADEAPSPAELGFYIAIQLARGRRSLCARRLRGRAQGRRAPPPARPRAGRGGRASGRPSPACGARGGGGRLGRRPADRAGTRRARDW